MEADETVRWGQMDGSEPSSQTNQFLVDVPAQRESAEREQRSRALGLCSVRSFRNYFFSTLHRPPLS